MTCIRFSLPRPGRGPSGPRTRRAARALAAALLCHCGLPAADARGALSFTVGGAWDTDARKAAATSALQNVVNRYNAYGDFGSYNIYAYYNAGIPTAQSDYLGSIGFGGTYPNDRVTQHESNHYLGSGTYWNWGNLFTNGVWTGPKINALIQQFDGDGAVIRQSGVHFYGYGLNYDNEVVNDSVFMRNVALMYAMRQDMGNGNAANPWTATNVHLAGSDYAGTSAFNWFGGGLSNPNYKGWSDKYFAHPGAAYFTDNYVLRTPVDTANPAGPTPNFTFAGNSLTVNNTNGSAGGLVYQGHGDGVVTIKNLTLNGGYVRHSSGAADLFQLAGDVSLVGTSTVDAAQGNINVLAPVGGAGSLTTRGAYTTTLAGRNTYTGTTRVGAGTLAFAGPQSNIGGVTVADGARLRVQASAGGTTTLTTSSLTLGTVGSAGLTFDFNGLGTIAGPLLSAGALSANGPVSVTLVNGGALPTGTYPLFAYTSLFGAGNLPSTPLPVGTRSTGTLADNGTNLFNLNVVADRPVWTGADNGNWVAAATGANKNWKLQAAGTATDYLQGDNVLFDDSAAGSAALAISGGNVSPLSTTFSNSSRNYTVSSAGGFGIAGGGGLTKNGSGALTLSTANTFTGDVVVNGGTLYANPGNAANNRAFSHAGGITVNGGTLRSGANGLFGWDGTQERPVTVNTGGTLSALGTLTTDVGVGLVTLNGGTLSTVGTTAADYGSFRFDDATDKLKVTDDSVVSAAHVKFGNPNATIEVAAGKTLRFTGTVTDATSGGISYLNKSGPGTLLMSGVNTYTGGTTVNAGTLTIAGSITGSPTTDVHGGATLAVSGSLSNTTTSVNRGSLLVTGTHSSTGDLWIGHGNGGSGSVAVQSGGTVNANVLLVGAGGSPTSVATGSGSLGAGGTVNTKQWFVIGQSGAAGSSGTFTVNGGTLNVHTDPTVVGNLEVGTFDAANATLNVNAGSDVRLLNNSQLVLGAQGNHTGTSVVNQNGGDVTFYANGGTTVGGTGRLVLASAGNPTGNYTYNLNGGTLTVPKVARDSTANNPATVFNFNGGTLKATSNQPAFVSGLTRASVKSGGARLDTNGFNVTVPQALLDGGSGGGLTKVGAGALTLAARNTYTGPTTVAGGTLAFGASQRLTSLTVGDGATAAIAPGTNRTLVIGSLSIAGGAGAWAGTFNLAGGGAAVDYAGGSPSPLLTIADEVRSGRNGGAWDGFGITSSLANARSIGVGYAESSVALGAAGGAFGTEAVDGTAVLLRAARYGDADLDGVVSSRDLLTLRRNFGATGDRAVWQNGDFNYDGRIDSADMALLRRNFGASLTTAPLGAEVSVVPEPTAAVTALLPLLGLLLRRRK